MNEKNFKKILNKIKKYPENWNQKEWHCGTQHCIAGHAQLAMKRKENNGTAKLDAREYFELSKIEASFLFDARRKIEDFETFLHTGNCCNMDEFNDDGYDTDGLDINNKRKKK